VGDGFVAGKFECTGKGARGMDGDVFHDDGSWRKFSTRGFWVAGAEKAPGKKRKELNAEAQSSQRKKELGGIACTGGQFYWGTR
jgi:hypothetical protein